MMKRPWVLALILGASMMTCGPAQAMVSNTNTSAYWSIYMWYDQVAVITTEACSTWPQGQVSQTTGQALVHSELVLTEEVGSPWPVVNDVNFYPGLTANSDGSMNCQTGGAYSDTGDPMYDLRLYNYWGDTGSDVQIIELQSDLNGMGS